MATRRDQFQSYQFMVQRVVSALVLRETDPVQSPLRRMSGAAFGSVMLAVLAVGVAGVIGVMFPGGNDRWRAGGAVIVERETGSNYVWMPDSSGEFHLYPVANFASAALLNKSPKTILVSRKSLARDDVPRGPQLGIPDAPESLPDPKRMLSPPWTLCSLPAKTISGDEVPNTALVIGRGTSKGVPIQSAAILVRDTERGSLHMVWRGYQYRVSDEAAVLEALTWRLEPMIRVGTAWLSALPAGKDLGPLRLKGEGRESTALPGARIGQIRVVVSGDSRQYYLVARNRIIAISQVQAEIQLADVTTRTLAYDGNAPVAQQLPASVATSTRRIDLAAGHPTDPPAEQPKLAPVNSDRSTVCASFVDAGLVPEVSVEAAVEGTKVALATEQRSDHGTVLADRILVRPGWGTIVESMMSPAASGGSLYLVTDEGKRYAVPSGSAKDSLGYSRVAPVQMPATLVARIPSGAALDPDAANDAR